MTTAPKDTSDNLLAGQRIALVGKLAGMSKREVQPLVRGQGGTIVERLDESVNLIVVGEADLPSIDGGIEESFDETLRQAVQRGAVEVITETQLWQRLGYVEEQQNIRRLYTPAMLAHLLNVPVSVIRRWHRRGLIVPAREVRKLPYFEFQEVATARRLAELLAAGVSPAAIERKLAALARFLPGVERPLAQLSVIVEGKHLLLRQGDGLVEAGGQLRFDFGSPADNVSQAPHRKLPSEILSLPPHRQTALPATSPGQILQLASQMEDEGQLVPAAEMYRAALAAGGPDAEVCFLLAELLYQLGDVTAARERYYMAIELDEDYVEARANLGCVLAETDELELAVAAFEGALLYHPDYADVHYHLARTLDELNRPDEADVHWKLFLNLAPDSPWAEEARSRLESAWNT